VARELTKKFEQQISGAPPEVLAALERPVRGEIVLVLGPHDRDEAPVSEADLDAAIDAALAAGSTPAAIAKGLAGESAHPRQAIYARVVARKLAREARARDSG
jgi:16S rRNA (cytidine1402-2'-O)-methyltransferase